MTISEKLRKWRGARKDGRAEKTQLQAATQLGVPLKTYIDWEQGRREPRGLARTALLERIGGK